MSDFGLNALFLVIGTLLAALTAIIAARLAHQNWQNQNWEQKREERRTAALSTVSTISHLIDRRLQRQRKFLWALRRKNPDDRESARLEYALAVTEWMDNLGRSKAALWADFDRYTMVSFEEDVHDEFARIGRSLEAAYRTGIPKPLIDEERDLNKLGRLTYEYTSDLLKKISAEDIRGLRDRWALTYENWDNLSSSYLLSRLFDLGGKR
ncbi:hypothetical protein [Brevundimonas aurantiaca]|jgi:hypothetical protein|uniref:hypothetical protein n=1 Tax=Brevundimonas aurantiaca TaxID=74316 RepID=UPI001D180C1C|nr:hypothetical protein [Brevundimonas aurantiaca]MCC4294985.1 hypothetical protein [Brevundimonas aurantiaca]